jgi:maleylacetate reductase
MTAPISTPQPDDDLSPLREALLSGASFTVAPSTARVRFGAGALDHLPELVDELGARRVLVLASARHGDLIERVGRLLGARRVGVETRAAMHVPGPLADAVRDDAIRSGSDLVVAIGGGSPIGMAKAIALGGGPPILAVPTTYSGSEMTNVWGVTRDGAKQTGRDERVRPRAVIYDPTLTLELPPRVSGPSGLNAMAHAVEALYAPDVNPLVALAATEGIRTLGGSVLRVVREPTDLTARTEALYAAWLCGWSLGAATMGLHHKLCHVLGGSFGLPHAETHAVVLPHAVAYNAPATPRAMAVIVRALGVKLEAPAALHALATTVLAAAGAPRSLRDLRLKEADLDRAAEMTATGAYPNPRPVTVEGVRRLLESAYRGG